MEEEKLSETSCSANFNNTCSKRKFPMLWKNRHLKKTPVLALNGYLPFYTKSLVNQPKSRIKITSRYQETTVRAALYSLINSATLQSSKLPSGRYRRMMRGVLPCESSLMAICKASDSPSNGTRTGAFILHDALSVVEPS